MGHVPSYVSAVCSLFIRHHRIDYCMNENVLLEKFHGCSSNCKNSKSFPPQTKKAIYRKWGKIRWAKLSHFSQFSRVPQKFYREYLFILYKLHIMALFKCFNIRHRESFLVKNFIGWSLLKFSPANLFPFMVRCNTNH